jgi:uncharacterized membrane protein (Fun14 family)
MERDSPSRGADKVRTGTIGALVAGYALFDVIPIAVIVVGLTAWFEHPLMLFLITGVALIVINVASCRWLQRHWDSWIAGNGERIEAKLEKMRASRVMKHPGRVDHARLRLVVRARHGDRQSDHRCRSRAHDRWAADQ